MKKVIFMSSILISIFSTNLFAEKIWNTPQEAYNKVCAYCHNTGVGPDSIKIKFDKNSIGARVESIMYVVRHGLNAMPAFRKIEIDDDTLKKMAKGLAQGTIK